MRTIYVQEESQTMIDPLNQAKSYATLHHVVYNKQMYGPLPYTHHLAAVESVLRRFGRHLNTDCQPVSGEIDTTDNKP